MLRFGCVKIKSRWCWSFFIYFRNGEGLIKRGVMQCFFFLSSLAKSLLAILILPHGGARDLTVITVLNRFQLLLNLNPKTANGCPRRLWILIIRVLTTVCT